jgi:hypothetical protein
LKSPGTSGGTSLADGSVRRVFFGDGTNVSVGEEPSNDDLLQLHGRLGIYMSMNAAEGVGIGTTTPATKLQVLGDIRVGTSGINGCVQRFDGGVLAGACSSDIRFKKDIRPLGKVLDRVARLEPVSYLWRADEFPAKRFGAERVNGLIAQQVEQVLPELVSTDEEGYKRINFSELPLLAIQAVRELKQDNDALRAELAELKQLLEHRLGLQVSKSVMSQK